MQIQAAQLQFSAVHLAERREQVTLRVERLAPRPAPAVDAPPPAAGTDLTLADTTPLDPALEPLVRLIEWLTGRSVRVFDLSAFSPGPAAAGSEARAPATAARIEAQRRYEEVEATVFRAEGSLVTADGERIAFTLQLALARSYREDSRVLVERGGAAARKDPLVINLDVPAAALRSQRFQFDLDADGRSESIATLARGSGYLVLDRNRNGRVDDGRELFGALSGDGFADLAAFDADGNGWIDAGDPVYERLQVWRADGSPPSLQPLGAAGVAAIATASVATPFALRGAGNADLGAVRSTGVYLGSDRRVGTVQQIDLSV